MSHYLPDPVDPLRLAGCRCDACDYDLKGCRSCTCPECGQPFDPLEVRYGCKEAGQHNPKAFLILIAPCFLLYSIGVVLLLLQIDSLGFALLFFGGVISFWPFVHDALCAMGLIDPRHMAEFLERIKQWDFRLGLGRRRRS